MLCQNLKREYEKQSLRDLDFVRTLPVARVWSMHVICARAPRMRSFDQVIRECDAHIASNLGFQNSGEAVST